MLNKSPEKVINFGYQVRLYMEESLKSLREKFNLKQSELGLLMMLVLYPEANTAKKICDMSEMKRGNVSLLVESLCNRGLILQESDSEDRRVKYLRVTSAADEITEKVKKIMCQCQQEVVSGICDADMKICESVFEKMCSNISEAIKNVNKEEK